MSIDKLALRILLPNGTMLMSHADIVRADIPVRLGLDVIKKCGLVLDLDQDKLRSVNPGWCMRLVHQFGNAFDATAVKATCVSFEDVPRTTNVALSPWERFYTGLYIHFTEAELPKIHLQLSLPSSDKLFALI